MKIRFIPTGNIFDLPQKECEKILSEDRSNLELVHSKEMITVPINKTPQQQIIKDDDNDMQKQKKEDIANINVDEEKARLIEEAKSLGITGNLQNCKIATLKKKIEKLKN